MKHNYKFTQTENEEENIMAVDYHTNKQHRAEKRQQKYLRKRDYDEDSDYDT